MNPTQSKIDRVTIVIRKENHQQPTVICHGYPTNHPDDARILVGNPNQLGKMRFGPSLGRSGTDDCRLKPQVTLKPSRFPGVFCQPTGFFPSIGSASRPFWRSRVRTRSRLTTLETLEYSLGFIGKVPCWNLHCTLANANKMAHTTTHLRRLI